MKVLADEGVDFPIVRRLRRWGLEVLYVAELAPGAKDHEVVALAKEEGALLVTTDKDFGELAFRKGSAPGGVLLLRLEGLSAQAKADRVLWALVHHGEDLVGAFSVLERDRLRIRRLPGSGAKA
ncbi:hypothetical protein TJA_03360 [Thermus sp. LT1-2-5]|uniref:DUF5615 family PIN-like protein n=1 Tax=Thermus sp. LT1-2-5 TaxID=3026935 RepID=UPI0030E8F629